VAYQAGHTQKEYTPWVIGADDSQTMPKSLEVNDYLNRADVKQALHVDETIVWVDCSGAIGSTYEWDKRGSIWLYPEFKQLGLKVLIYSGDTDGAVPTWGTRQWIEGLDWKIMTETTPWFVNNQF